MSEQRTEIHLRRDDLALPSVRQFYNPVNRPNEQHERRKSDGGDHGLQPRVEHAALRGRDERAHGPGRGVVAEEVDAARGVHAESDELEDDPAEHDVAAEIAAHECGCRGGNASAKSLYDKRDDILSKG